jgi:hypothetical protein
MILCENLSFWSYGFVTYNLLHACKLGIKLLNNNFSENHVTTLKCETTFIDLTVV